MKKRQMIIIVLMAVVPFLVIAGSLQAQTYSWKFASGEIEGDMMTVFAKKFADEMKQWSDGKVNITVYPYGTLGQERDINELAQTNTVQFVFTDFGWIAGFVPQAQVFALAYLWPREKYKEVYGEVIRNGKAVKLLEEKFRKRRLQPLGYVTEGWMAWTTNKPINSIDDMKGVKMRVMSNKILVENFRAFGASPTPLDFGEVYSGLQMKLIDGQANPLWVGYSMKFYEVQNHFTITYDNLFVAIPCMNRDVYDSLPKDMQAKMKEIFDRYLDETMDWVHQKDEEYKKIMLNEKPALTFSDFSNEQLKPFAERAKPVYPKFTELGGDDAQQILNALLEDIEKAKAKFGVQ
ncbi:MAG: TRAP transporter substrate-binding protein DctP [Desulfobacterales bacterium]|nr:MAG: TRAP transporter substrate-binding protein DctP [Desulfobacterales bacterium]